MRDIVLRSNNPCKIEYYADGVRTTQGNTKGTKGPGGKRGTCKGGWSSASRRRMREKMLSIGPKEDTILCSVSYTVPGPAITPEQAGKLWKNYKDRISRRGWGAIWRLEVQKRGALHWHALLAVPKNKVRTGDDLLRSVIRASQNLDDKELTDFLEGLKDAPEEKQIETALELLGDKYLHSIIENEAREVWHDSLTYMGPQTFAEPYPLKNRKGEVYGHVTHVDSLMAFPGAWEYSAHAECGGNDHGRWKRYLQDHASKSKQEQIADGFGKRHWGVIGEKKVFQPLFPESVQELTADEFYEFMRYFQRLCTPQLKSKNEKTPFGRRLGYRVKRGTRGKAVFYSNPDNIKRLADHAIEAVKHKSKRRSTKPLRLDESEMPRALTRKEQLQKMKTLHEIQYSDTDR